MFEKEESTSTKIEYNIHTLLSLGVNQIALSPNPNRFPRTFISFHPKILEYSVIVHHGAYLDSFVTEKKEKAYRQVKT